MKLEYKKLIRWAKTRFIFKLLFYCISLFFLVLHGVFNGYSYLLPFIIAVFYAHGTQLMHQLTHGVFSKNQDRVIGFLLGIPMFENFSEYKYSHIHHHKYIGTKNYRCHPTKQPKGILRLGYQILEVFKIVTYVNNTKKMFQSIFNISLSAENERQKKHICQDYKCMLLFYSVFLMLSIYLNIVHIVYFYWFIPFIIASLYHAIIEFTVHAGCNMNSTDSMLNSNSVTSNAFMRWFSNYSCFHAEHHQYLNIPVDAIYVYREQYPSNPKYKYHGYFSLFRKLISSVFKKP